MSSGSCFYSGFSNKEIFIALVCITIIVHGVTHFLATHELMPKVMYKDDVFRDDVIQNRSLPTPRDDTQTAEVLYRDVRIVCMIMTNHESIWSRGIHINNTWARRCNRAVFISDVSDPEIQTVVGIYGPEGGGGINAIQKLYDSFDYVYDHHYQDADWFLKCDDETYVIMENLRYFLSKNDPDQPVFFGQKFRNTKRHTYLTGRAGYVLSKAALKTFKNRPRDLCLPKGEGVNEDVQVSACLGQLGVQMGDTRDVEGRTTFHSFSPIMHLAGVFPDWYRFRSVWGVQKGPDSISPYAISFHRLEDVSQFYLLEFFIYRIRPYGIKFD